MLHTIGDKRIQSINSIETYTYETSKNSVRKKDIKCNNIDILSFACIARKNIKQNNPYWSQIFDYLC